jgi:hypothetical protein
MSTIHEDDAFEHRDFDRLLDEVSTMDDDALDALVARAAADYHAPPARPPVDAMWAHIAAAQRPAARGGIRVQRWQLLAASVAFLAFGITIGRQWTSVSAHAGAPAARPAHAPARGASAPSAVATTAGSPSETDTTQVGMATPKGSTGPGSHALASARTRPHAAPRATDDASTGTTSTPETRGDAAYRVATMRHFVAAEALLASYDGSAHDAKTDAQLASWASDLLSQTRLLLDSPAGRDPVRRRLLQDLELVLVQMAQLGPNSPKLEHDLIDGSVRHNDIITRLRSAVPAGATTAL